jgi:hypothetical protein
MTTSDYTYLERKKALTNQIYASPALRSAEMVGNAVEVTDDSIAVNRDVIARLVKIITNLQFQIVSD